MPRPFVVVAKVAAVVPDFEKLSRRNRRIRRGAIARPFGPIVAFPENRMERIVREDVFDIGHEQLLVLLFVVQSDR